MTRSEQAESTYQAMLGINRVKAKYGAISEAEARQMESRLLYEMDVMKEIDEIMGDPDPEVRAVRLRGLKKRVDKYSVASAAGRYKELDWLTQLFAGGRLCNVGLFNFRLMGILRTIMTPSRLGSPPGLKASRIVGGSE
jgi:hypothetical protein